MRDVLAPLYVILLSKTHQLIAKALFPSQVEDPSHGQVLSLLPSHGGGQAPWDTLRNAVFELLPEKVFHIIRKLCCINFFM